MATHLVCSYFIVCCTATTAAVEGKMSKSLKKLLKKLVVGEAQEQLAVADAKLGNVIKVVLRCHKFAVKFWCWSISDFCTDVWNSHNSVPCLILTLTQV